MRSPTAAAAASGIDVQRLRRRCPRTPGSRARRGRHSPTPRTRTGVVMTSSPSLTPTARSARCRPAVPLETALACGARARGEGALEVDEPRAQRELPGAKHVDHGPLLGRAEHRTRQRNRLVAFSICVLAASRRPARRSLTGARQSAAGARSEGLARACRSWRLERACPAWPSWLASRYGRPSSAPGGVLSCGCIPYSSESTSASQEAAIRFSETPIEPQTRCAVGGVEQHARDRRPCPCSHRGSAPCS